MEGDTERGGRLGCGFGSCCLAAQYPAEASRHGEEFVLANFVVGSRIGGVERGDGQFMDGLAGGFAEAGEDNAGWAGLGRAISGGQCWKASASGDFPQPVLHHAGRAFFREWFVFSGIFRRCGLGRFRPTGTV